MNRQLALYPCIDVLAVAGSKEKINAQDMLEFLTTHILREKDRKV